MVSRRSTFIAIGLAVTTLAGSASDVFAAHSHYRPTYHPGRHYGGHYRHYGADAAVAGAALGIIGGAVAGIAADRHYNGYPAYTYGPGYGANYGYDYHPSYGYYGPY